MKSIEWFLGFLISWILLLTISKCHGFRIEHKLSPYDKWLITKRYIQDQEQRRLFPKSGIHKRGCKGFPCMYTHMGGTAGNASLKKAKLKLLRECMGDPTCFSPGKRSGSQDMDYNVRRYQILGDTNRDRDSSRWEKEVRIIPDGRETSLDSFNSYTNYYENPALNSDTDISEAFYHHY